FQGDYFAAEHRWREAIDAYKKAAGQDPENDGARAGLIDALSALGQPSRRELLAYAQQWEVGYPGSAADAYRAVLTLSFAPGAQRDATADSAVLGLIRIQSRNRLSVGDVPEA